MFCCYSPAQETAYSNCDLENQTSDMANMNNMVDAHLDDNSETQELLVQGNLNTFSHSSKKVYFQTNLLLGANAFVGDRIRLAGGADIDLSIGARINNYVYVGLNTGLTYDWEKRNDRFTQTLIPIGIDLIGYLPVSNKANLFANVEFGKCIFLDFFDEQEFLNLIKFGLGVEQGRGMFAVGINCYSAFNFVAGTNLYFKFGVRLGGGK